METIRREQEALFTEAMVLEVVSGRFPTFERPEDFGTAEFAAQVQRSFSDRESQLEKISERVVKITHLMCGGSGWCGGPR